MLQRIPANFSPGSPSPESSLRPPAVTTAAAVKQAADIPPVLIKREGSVRKQPLEKRRVPEMGLSVEFYKAY